MARVGYCKHDVEWGGWCRLCEAEEEERKRQESYIPPAVLKELNEIKQELAALKEAIQTLNKFSLF